MADVGGFLRAERAPRGFNQTDAMMDDIALVQDIGEIISLISPPEFG